MHWHDVSGRSLIVSGNRTRHCSAMSNGRCPHTADIHHGGTRTREELHHDTEVTWSPPTHTHAPPHPPPPIPPIIQPWSCLTVMGGVSFLFDLRALRVLRVENSLFCVPPKPLRPLRSIGWASGVADGGRATFSVTLCGEMALWNGQALPMKKPRVGGALWVSVVDREDQRRRRIATSPPRPSSAIEAGAGTTWYRPLDRSSLTIISSLSVVVV